MNKKKQLEEYTSILMKIDESIGDLLDYIVETIDEPCDEDDADGFYHDIHTMSLFSNQAITRLRKRILKEA